MHDCKCSDPYLLVKLIYGEEEGEKLGEWLKKRLETFSRPIETRPLDQSDAVLITYADQFRKEGEAPLQTLYNFSRDYLKDVVSGIHILPFFPYSSDDGFSVIDYRQVEPDFGSWEQIKQIGSEFRLMVDAVVNHISAKSEWFEGYLNGEEKYQDYFISLPKETDLSKVVRPRTSPLLTEVDTVNGKKWVWTTFSEDQIDLNFKNPEVFKETVDNLLLYVENHAQFIRLDAIAYLWKEIDTNCIHLPKTHLFVNFMNALFKEVAPYVKIITETNVPHADNVSYFGNGINEAHMVYNFALPPLVLHSFQQSNAQLLCQWAESLSLPSNQVTFFNFLASHDGIGLNPARGILTEYDINEMAKEVFDHGGLVSRKTNSDGTQSPYELNVNYFDALSNPESSEPIETQVKRFLASQAIMLSVVGVPGIYVHSLLGSRNWTEGVRKTGRNRSINRYKFMDSDIRSELKNENSTAAMVYRGYRNMLQTRSRVDAFHPHGAQMVIHLHPAVFSIVRVSADGMRMAFCLHNVSNEVCCIPLSKTEGWIQKGCWIDQLTGEGYDFTQLEELEMQPYQVLWLVPDNC